MSLVRFFVNTIVLVLLSWQALAVDPTGFAILNGSETTNVGDPTDLNQTAAPMKWSASSFDSTYFDHSTSSFSHEVTIQSFGDYKLSLNVPLTLENTSGNRRQVIAEVYVNGAAVSHGRAASSYIRQASGHAESSLHTVILLESLSSNDKITVYFSQGAFTGKVSTTGAQLTLEYVDSSRSLFTATATQTTAGTNMNPAAAASVEWSESLKDSDYTHNDGASPENITLAAGDYMVAVNIPIVANGACAGRVNPRVTVRLGGATVTGGSAAQGYIRCIENNDSSSIHWVGLLAGVTGGQVLTVQVQAETTRADSFIVPAGREASIFIEKVTASSEFISLTGTSVLTGANWNPSVESEVQWGTQLAYDSGTFTHSTVTNNHRVTIATDGDYYLTYNDHMTSTAARANNIARIKVNGSVMASGVCKTHYIRNSEGHNESSCSLTQYLQGLTTADQVSIEHVAEALAGTVNDASPARLTLQRVGPASDSGSCTNIIDCTPDRILHYDGQQLQTMLDDVNRTANDVSFDGTVATLLDVSGSTTDHDSTQGAGANEPTFNAVTSGMTFDGTDYFDIANHADLNLGTLKEKSIIAVFQTGADVTTPQVIYEEGGGIRGMNVYIRNSTLYIAFWNLNNDGDGAQAFTSASTPIAANTFYYTSLVIDYSNYTGPAGPDGQLRGHINGSAFPSIGTTTSLLYPHGGAIALGGMRNDTYFDTGAQGGNGHYFNGEIYEFIIYNHAINDSESVDFYTYLSDKWPDPQPMTNVALTDIYTTDNTQSPQITWTDSVSPDVVDYETAVGTTPGAEDVQAYTSQGNVTSVNISGLSLSQCTDYYASVKAIDSGADESTVETTDFFRYDGINPSDPSGINVTGTASTSTSKDFSWTSSTDDCSLAGYEVSLGLTAGVDDVVAWTDIGNTNTHTFTGLSLSGATDYYFNIRALDEAGNTSTIQSSSSWQVDTCVASDVTDPTDPTSLTVVGDAGPTSSPNHTWVASTDGCGLSHYEVAVGTTAGASDVITFTDVGNVLTHKFFNVTPTLSTNQNYYTTVRAVDLAGNTSNDVTSSAWQLPTPGGVSSGLVLWLDADDSGTVFTDNGCSTPATLDNDPIGCWQDKSTSTNNATATGGNRPTLQLSEFNNQSVLRFDGTDDALDFTNINNIRTVFVVNKSNAATFQLILGHTTSRNFYTNNSTLLDGTISSADLRSGSWRANQANVSSPTTFTQSGSYAMISVVSTGNVEADHISSDLKTGGRFFNGDVVEVIIYDRALNSTEITNVETYLYNKWFTPIPAAVTGLAFATDFSTNSTDSPVFDWTHSTAPDLSYYEVALGTAAGSNDISGWTNVGLVSSYQFLGQSLTECQDIYASVRAVDTDTYVSSFESTGIGQFDGTSPSTPTGLILSGTSSPTDSQTLNWSPSTDNCSSATYEVALGTSAGGNDVIDWTTATGTSHEFTGISPDLAYATDYYLSVRATDLAGNVSSVASSSSWQLDTCIASDVTAPTDPSGLNLSGASTVIQSRTLTWSASTDACAFDHYDVAIGTSAGASDVVTWTNVGDVTSYQFNNLSSNLNFATNYFLSVRGVDSAGNQSSAIASSAWQLTTPGNVSPTGLSMWLDADDSLMLYQDSGCSATPVASDSDRVQCFRDKSGNDNHATNSSSGNSPIYRTTQFNGNPSVYFDGSLDEYLTFNSTVSDIRTVFWVIKEDSSKPGNTAFLLGNSAGATAHFHRDSTSGPIFSAASASANVTGGTLQLNQTSTNGTTTNMPTSEAVLSLVTTGNVTADSFSQDRTSCCGNRTWGGLASEVIIFNRALTGLEVTDVENYLMLKWGVAATSTQWLGTTDTNWFTPTNWSSGVPDATKTCIIPNQTNNPVINGTGICRNVEITTGQLTLQAATNSTLAVYGDLSNNGSITFNDGQVEMRDDGITNTDQNISSSTTLGDLTFNKTAGGSVTTSGTLTLDAFSIPGGSFFTFEVPNGATLNLTTGMSQSAGTFDLDGGATINVTNGQSINVTGGTFQVSGTNDVYPQNTANKGTITSAGRWGFNASSGNVALTGFILDRMNVSGFQITGDANLTAFDGGQFINLLNDFATPVRALVINTTSSITETLASNIGFSWTSANATYSGTATPADNYFLVHANNCNNSVLVFDQWFGDFWGTAPQPVVEDKIQDTDDGGTCQISMDVAASPVHLLSFTATPYDQATQLDWETGSEINHLGFNIYRSESLYGNYEQINQEIIQNFVNTTSFRGKYRYIDAGLTNDQTYFYMIEDIALDGERTLHGPVAVTPMNIYTTPSSDSGLVDTNIIADGNDTPSPNTDVISDDSDVLTETLSGLRVRIRPSALSIADADWNATYKRLEIPGYGHSLTPGEPELLTRRFLIEVKQAYSSVSAQQVNLSFNDYSSTLAGQPVTPAPLWTLNASSGQLESSYTPDATTYALNQWIPGQLHEVQSETIVINGKNFLQIDVIPVRYNPVTDQLEQINELVLDIALDGDAWDQPPVTQSFVPEPDAVENNLKISFNQTGIYQVTYDDIAGAELDGPLSGAALNDLRLYHHGVEIALEIDSADGLFNSGDKLRFYARYQPELESKVDQVILSEVDFRKDEDIDPDFDQPLRIEFVNNGYAQQPLALKDYHLQQKSFEQNILPVFDVPLGSYADHIYWQRIFTAGGASMDSNSHFDLNSTDMSDLHTSNDQNILIHVELRGRGVFALNPIHHIGLYLNGSGSPIQTQTFTGLGPQTITFKVPSYEFIAGDNDIRLSSLATYVNSGDYDLIDINHVQIEYPAHFIADSDHFTIHDQQPNQQMAIAGFTTDQLKVYDVSHRYETMIYQTVSVSDYQSAKLLQFDTYQGQSGLAGRSIEVIANNSYKTPLGLELTFGSINYLKDPQFGGDYLVIAPRKLLGVLEELAVHREAQGHLVQLVALEQIYAEFSGGRVSTKAIQDFMSHLLTLATVKPKYLLLVGDATYDSKGDLNSYGATQMPMPIESGQQMDFGSDNFFVEQGSSLPSIAIGRLPSSNEIEIRNYISKLIAYESGDGVPSNAKRNAFISGLDTVNENFNSQIDKLQQSLSSQNTSLAAQKISLADFATNADKKNAIEQVFSQDSLITTYYGHGAENIWGDTNLFDEEDALNLTNNKLPIVMALNCLNTYFYDIDSSAKSIGENFIFNENAGAIAFWGSSSQTSPVAQMNLAQAFFSRLATATNQTAHDVRLGDLILQAKIAQGDNGYSNDTVRSWTLFGDPALKIPAQAFAEQTQEDPTLDVTQPGQPAPAPVSAGGGGCSAFASEAKPLTPPLQQLLMELFFFLAPLLIVFILRKRKVSANF